MASVLSAITNTIPITQFNRGLAGKIFDEVNDARLLAMAFERMSHFDPSTTISGEEMNRRFGVTESAQEGFDAVEIE